MLLSILLSLPQGPEFGASTLLEIQEDWSPVVVLEPLPDLDGDSLPDILILERDTEVAGRPWAGHAQALSGANGVVIRTWSGTSANQRFGTAGLSHPDLNGDGHSDLLICDAQGTLHAFDAITGTLHYTAPEVFGPGLTASDTRLRLTGDLDGDGVEDILMASPSVHFPSDGLGTAVSGADGQILWLIVPTLPWSWGVGIDSTEDLTGDGIHDLFVMGNSVIECRSGADGSLVWTKYPFSGADGLLFTLDDIDGDGIQDLIEGGRYTSTVAARSGATGDILYLLYPHTGRDAYFSAAGAAMGDVDGDGFEDFFLTAYDAFYHGVTGWIYLYSGADGAEISEIPGAPERHRYGHPNRFCATGDFDGDGLREFMSISDFQGSDENLLQVQSLAAPIDVAVTGTCPGPVTLSVTGGFPDGRYGLAVGSAGQYLILGGPVDELLLGVGSPTYRTVRSFDATGADGYSSVLPPGLCGLHLQAFDLTTRATSNVVIL